MAVLLGENGQVELRRLGLDAPITGTVTQSDVNTSKDRFSFGFAPGTLLTGDYAEIQTTDGSLLSFVDAGGWSTGTQYSSGTFYLYVDEVGAIRLYRKFDDAVAGETTGRVHLVNPGRSVPISLQVRNLNERVVGQVIGFELNTERDVVDTTALSDEFRSNISGLISGSGSIECFFDYEARPCDPATACYTGGVEMPLYLHQLLLRTKIGSEFWAKLTLVRGGTNKPSGRFEDRDDAIWYEFNARISNVGMSFAASQPIRSTIQFVATGEIKLRTRFVSNYLLQQDGGRLALEANQTGYLELEQEE